MNSRTISCSINRPAPEVYYFASNPENLPQWIKSFCLSVRRCEDNWEMETPSGWIGIRFVPDNEFGVLDHTVTLPDGQSILNPMRVVTNGEGSEVMFTLFQLPGMSGEQFTKDASMVEADLLTLKCVLEGIAS
ncbi:SRPBCC family protein [Planctomicrobium sp. SH527]|uniref:SRPBCC family protein n=1 Tax=Planctomicrobium sp. SH527 TaxID=3448123 RepID=UPI003F5AF256